MWGPGPGHDHDSTIGLLISIPAVFPEQIKARIYKDVNPSVGRGVSLKQTSCVFIKLMMFVVLNTECRNGGPVIRRFASKSNVMVNQAVFGITRQAQTLA